MKFYTVSSEGALKDFGEDVDFPCFVLRKVNWDDYGYKTTFVLSVNNSFSTSKEIGELKILDIDGDTTHLPNSFESLEASLCSLGQEINYYQRISKLSEELRKNILTGLRDVVFDKEIYNQFRIQSGFRNSLIRYEAAVAALEHGREFIADQVKEEYGEQKFTYKKRLKHALNDHFVKLDFSPRETIPFRTNVFIGKNGTGKSSILKSMAEDLANKIEGNEVEGAEINGPLNFENVIYFNSSSLDSSSFNQDEFGPLKSFKIIKKIDESDGISKKLKRVIQKLQKKRELSYWLDIIRDLLGNDGVNIFSLESDSVDEEFRAYKAVSTDRVDSLSSGQKLLLYTVLNLAGEIKKNSLLLFDEPESHLHPNMLTQMIKTIDLMLERTESYCIYSTHSPLIVQQTPSRSVHWFWREGTSSKVDKLPFETFGESLHTIVDQVFNITDEESGFKSWLLDAGKSYVAKEEIERELGQELPLNARLVLGSVNEE